MANPCYRGKNPIDDDPRFRMTVWKWIRPKIEEGQPIDKIHEAINKEFFAGQAKPEWITDILSGRKTPFKEVANDMWKKAYNRRQIVSQAERMTKDKPWGPSVQVWGHPISAKTIWDFPRSIAVGGHGLVFPITHAGDLIFRPSTWGVFFKGLFNTYTKALGPGARANTERLLGSMQQNALFDTALRSGLDVGARSHAGNLLNRPAKGGLSTRVWDVLTVTRFNLWEKMMEKHLTPEMSQSEVLNLGKHFAEWANHATGSAKGPVASLGGNVLFGPALTQSKLNRLFYDPAKTVITYGKMALRMETTPGERAVAHTRFSGAVQMAGTMLGGLIVNQGLIMATGSKDPKDQINFFDPNKSDWLAFKANGVEFSMPGMHSEIRTIGEVLKTAYISATMTEGEAKKVLFGEGPQAHLRDILGGYALGKLTPTLKLGQEVLMQKAFPEKPLPWSSDPGTAKNPRMDAIQYTISHSPIPLVGPISYFYDQLKNAGASSFDASSIIKGLIISALSVPGIHAKDVNPAQPSRQLVRQQEMVRTRELIARERASRELLNR